MNTRKLFLTSLLAAAAMGTSAYATTTVTVGDYTQAFDSITSGNTAPTSATPAWWLTGNGGKLEVKSTAQANVNNAGVVILGNGTYSTDGGDATAATATQLFLQGWGSPAAIDITSTLVLGANSGESNAALRFGADGNYDVKVSGDMILGADAKIIGGGTHGVISGGISGNRVLTITNMNSAFALAMTGATDKTISLSGLTISGNTTVNMNYKSASLGVLNLSGANAAISISGSENSYSAASLAGAGTLTIDSGVTFTLNNSATTAGTNQTFSGTLAGSGELKLTGGVQKLSGVTAANAINVAGGKLVLAGTNTINGAVTVSGGELDLSGATVSLSSAIQNSSSVTVSAGTVFNLTQVGANTLISNINSGSILGWNLLGNFTYNGATITVGRGLTSSVEGVVNYDDSVVAKALTWDGGPFGTWKDAGFSKNPEKPWTSNDGAEAFYRGDSVTFETENAEVTVSGTVIPSAMTISAATSFTGTGTVRVDAANLTTDAVLTLGENVRLDLGTMTNTNNTVDLSGKLAGTGTIVLAKPDGDHNNVIRLGDDFSGILEYTGRIGQQNLPNVGAKTTLKLNNVWLWGTSAATINQKVIITGADGYINKGSATFAGETTIEGAFDVQGEGTLLNISGKTTAATLKVSGGTLNIDGDAEKTIATLTVSGGTANFNGAAELGSVYVTGGTLNLKSSIDIAGNTSNSKGFRQQGGTVNLGDGTNAASLTVVDFVGSSNGSANGEFNIKNNAVMTVTGTKTNATVGFAHSFQLAHWDATETFNVAGVLNLSNVSLSSKDGTGVVNVNAGGELNLNAGLAMAVNGGSVRLNLSGGTMNIGASGIAAGQTLNLNSGTIGSLADSWTSSRDMALGGAIVVDTTKKIYTEGAAAAATASGSEVTLNGVLSDASEATGSLTKRGAGTLTLSGHNTYSGGTTIEGGVLKVESLGWSFKGNLGTKFTQDGTVLKNGGVLEVTAAQDATAEGNDYGKGGALRGFSVTNGEGTYRYSGSGTSLVSHNSSKNSENQHIGVAAGATLIFDVTQDSATLDVSKIIASNAAQASMEATLAETTGALKKIGAGTVILSGANLYSGGTTISVGRLVAAHANALGTGVVTVERGAELGLVAETTLTVTNGIDLADGAKLVVDLSSKASATETFTLDLVSGTALRYNGVAFEEDCTSLITGGIVVLENMNLDGWTQSLSYANNTLSLTMTIPEPSVFGLLAGLGALALAGTRRRRKKA